MSLVFPHPNLTRPQHQQGAALILALMVVVLVVLLATSLGSDFLVTFKRVENQLQGQQAYAYMRGAEGLARQQLQLDFIDDGTNGLIDHDSEGLNQRVEFPLDQGAIAGTLCDLQARFNINLLPGKPTPPARYTIDQAMFIRLLQLLELDSPIDQQAAEDLTQAVIDWIDVDSNIGGTGGAEDGYYADLELPMRAANRPLQSVSELRWVKGFSAEIVNALSPYIVALSDTALVNVNTADAMVLRAINQVTDLTPLSESDVASIITDRDGEADNGPADAKAGFTNVADFASSHPLTTLDTSHLSVNSEYFLLQTETIFMDRKYTLYSVLHRSSDGVVTTIARGHNGFGQCHPQLE